MGHDLLVNLYQMKQSIPKIEGVRIHRILSPNYQKLEAFICEAGFSLLWAEEVKAGMYQSNPTVFIAVKDQKIIGFAGYDCTAKGFFGPTGVDANYRGLGVGKALLYQTLYAMFDDGYAYAIIGGVGSAFGFYNKHLDILKIENNEHSVYDRMIK